MAEKSNSASPVDEAVLPKGALRLIVRRLTGDAVIIKRLIAAARQDVAVGSALNDLFGLEFPKADLPASFIFLSYDRERHGYRLQYTDEMQVAVTLNGRRCGGPELRDEGLAKSCLGIRSVNLGGKASGFLLLAPVIIIYFDFECAAEVQLDGAEQLREEDEMLAKTTPK